MSTLFDRKRTRIEGNQGMEDSVPGALDSGASYEATWSCCTVDSR